MLRNPASSIREAIEFQCPLCCQEYNDDQRFPMIICKNQHNVCLNCLNQVLFKKKNECDCPFCKLKIVKNQTERFRLLNEIRATAQRLRVEGSTIRRAIQGLSHEKETLEEQLANEKQKNQFLIQQTKQKQMITQQRLQREVSEVRAFYELKIQALEKEVQIIQEKLTQTVLKKKQQQQNERPSIKLQMQVPIGETKLDLSGRGLKTVDITMCNLLKKLVLKNNQLRSIDLSKNISLVQLDLGWNRINNLDLLQNTSIAYINLYDNYLESLSLNYSEKLSIKTVTLGNQHSVQCVVELCHRRQELQKCKKLRDELSAQLNEGKGEQYKKYINAYKCRYTFILKQF